LITDGEGEIAPRLNDVTMSGEQAREDHALVMQYVMRMLCAGLVHGDLSEFNVLVNEDGPVIIDLPQSVDAAANNNARSMLERDVKNITKYYGLFAPELLGFHYAQEMWALFEEGELHPDYELTGDIELDTHTADANAVLQEIKAVLAEEESRRERLIAAESKG